MTPRLDQVDLRLLRVFATVADCGGFSAAQVELNVGQSTISSHMAALETRLGMRLCERGRAGFRLTEEGRRIYEATQRLFRSVETFHAEMAALRGRLTGEIHIGTVDNVATNPRFALSRAIDRFKQREGAVHITMHVGTPAEIERAVVDGRIHIGMGGYTRQLSGLEYIPLLREHQLLYCSRGHPLFAVDDDALSLRDLSHWEFVKRSYFPDASLPHGNHLNASAVAANMEAIALLVLSGRFIGFLPVHYASRWVEQGEMRAIRPDVMHYESELELLTRKGQPQQLAVRLFKEDLLAAFRETRAAMAA